jgi:hypothetical protein
LVNIATRLAKFHELKGVADSVVEYAQALAFDQLQNLMRNGQAFVGFNEAPIDFPPTFKYDVLRTSKKPRRTSSKLGHWKRTHDRSRPLTEVEEQALEDDDEDGEPDGDEEGGRGETDSVNSSVWTSVNSRPGTDLEDDDYFDQPSSSKSPNTPSTKLTSVATAAAIKAKSKWLSMVSPITPPSTPTREPKSRSVHRHIHRRSSSRGRSSLSVEHAMDQLEHRPSTESARKAAKLVDVIRVSSTKSGVPSDDEDSDDEKDRGVYDSSSKKRVPSW